MVRMVGYGGLYKDFMLRSTYEYICAVWLDRQELNWSYEDTTYTFSNNDRYTPDFFIYDEDDKLLFVIEVKTDDKRRFEEMYYKKDMIEKEYNIPCKIILHSYLKNNLDDYHQLEDRWKEYSLNNFSTSDFVSGEHNPMYGLKHTDKTKRLIGEKSAKRLKDPEYRKKMEPVWSTLGDRAKALFTGIERSEREDRICPSCGTEFRVTLADAKQYCSLKCANDSNQPYLDEGRETMSINRENSRKELQSFVYEWSLNNKDIIINTPYNKITTNLKELYDNIENKFNISDARTISKSVLSPEDRVGRSSRVQYSRKDMLKHLKEFVKNQ